MGEDWADCSANGSIYECQFDTRSQGRYRHRRRGLIRATAAHEGRALNDIWEGDEIEDAWHEGLAPDMEAGNGLSR